MTTTPRYVAVFDIGKTNAKLAVVDTTNWAERAVRKTPNTVAYDAPYPHFSIDGLLVFFTQSLRELNAEFPIDAISITTHGASAALVDAGGSLVLPVLDYEYDGPDDLTREYDAVRPPFSETLSPRLPMGLNVGAQLFWLQKRYPDEFSRARHILTLPQYWAMRLTGIFASEATSLGCHTDLWNPQARELSTMVVERGWNRLFPPLRSAFDALGPLLPQVCNATGVSPSVQVHCGIHDSNASLLPHLLSRTPPFSVVSTGTWVIMLSSGGNLVGLDPARDTLANSDAFGRPIASARFMGGREYDTITAGVENHDPAALQEVLDQPYLLLPSVEPGSGPFPQRQMQWLPAKPETPLLSSAASLYLAMMAATSLAISGGDGEIIIEGPFSGNRTFLDMLQVATGRPVLTSTSSTGTSIGAALLATGQRSSFEHISEKIDAPAGTYREKLVRWRDLWLSEVGN